MSLHHSFSPNLRLHPHFKIYDIAPQRYTTTPEFAIWHPKLARFIAVPDAAWFCTLLERILAVPNLELYQSVPKPFHPVPSFSHLWPSSPACLFIFLINLPPVWKFGKFKIWNVLTFVLLVFNLESSHLFNLIFFYHFKL